MRKHVGILVLAALIVLALLLSTVCYQVDELQDVVMVSTFGKLGEPVWGRKPREAYQGRTAPGLHFKAPWPFQQLIRYDARTFLFEDPYEQIQTRDGQALMVASFCSWRISDPQTFRKSGKTVRNAQEKIREKLRAHKSGVLVEHEMGELLNTDPKKVLLEVAEKELLRRLKAQVEEVYGVEVLATRVKVWGLTQQINTAVIEAQKGEREKVAKAYASMGESLAKEIRGRAKSASDKILEFAKRKARAVRTEGDRVAATWYAKYEQNPELAMFLRSLQALREALKKNTTIWLDGGKIAAIRFLQDGPSLEPFQTGSGAGESNKTAGKPSPAKTK